MVHIAGRQESSDVQSSPYQTITGYHRRTKHHFHRYARSAGYMDWANQPVPFRFYEGVQPVRLPLCTADPGMPYADLYSAAQEPSQPLTLTSLASFLELSLGLAAWKAAGASRWSLRINPSSGNLHPTEGYAILPHLPDLPGGVFHYNPFLHALEQRTRLPDQAWPLIEAHYGGPGFWLALSSIFWRESWKYGERAYRYCNLDAGHALAALTLAARLNNWRLTCLPGAGDDQIDLLLGFDRTPWHPQEAEAPEMVCWVAVGPGAADIPRDLPDRLVQPFRALSYAGRPNRLSQRTTVWSLIDEAARATHKPPTKTREIDAAESSASFPPPREPSAVAVIRRRRSAVSYDARRFIDTDCLYALLDRTLPHSGAVPFAAGLMSPHIQLLVFVHRVRGTAPGLYLLSRGAGQEQALRRACNPDFEWRPMHAALPLYRLMAGDFTHEAMKLSCHQEIAGHSALALAMIAPFAPILSRQPYMYRLLHWECGLIGQVLYLEAEAHGLGATGIGCFFDDGVHQLLGLPDDRFQVLYHFTIGHPIPDTRLATLPAYHHLQDDPK